MGRGVEAPYWLSGGMNECDRRGGVWVGVGGMVGVGVGVGEWLDLLPIVLALYSRQGRPAGLLLKHPT